MHHAEAQAMAAGVLRVFGQRHARGRARRGGERGIQQGRRMARIVMNGVGLEDVAGQIPIAQWFEAPRQIGFGGMGHESRPVEGRGHSTLPSAKDSYRYSPLPVFCE